MAWLDFFRGAAVLLMIETHVANSFLDAAVRGAAWFGWMNYVNGLVAPSFLFIAGFAQGMTWQRGAGKPGAFARKAWRLAGIAALGYALHFPFAELGDGRWSESLRVGTQVDVLPCLAVSLLGLLGVTWCVHRLPEKWRAAAWWGVVGGLAGAVVLAAPGVADWRGAAVPVRAYVNASTGSLFPLFPWAGFVFCGALCGAMAAVPALARAALAIGLVVLAGAIRNAPFSAVSPSFFVERLAWVMLLALLCEWLIRDSKAGAICFAGRESLLMYAAHLMIIPALVGAGLSMHAFSLAATAGIFALVLAATFGIAFAKARWQARRSAAAARVEGVA